MAYKATRQILLGGIADAPTTATSEYAPIVGGGNSSATWAATESWRRVKFPIAGNLSHLKVKINAAPGVGHSVTFTLMKNGSAQAMAITIADGNTEGEYTGVISVAAGDDFTIRHTTTGTPTLHTVSSWRIMFTPTATKRCVLLGGTGNGTGDVITTEYVPLFYNGNGWITTITGQQSLNAIDGTIRSWRMTLSGAPAASATMDFYIYKNGVQEATSKLAFTSGSGTTLNVSGLSIDIAPGDLLAIGCVTAGAVSTARFQRWGVEVEPDTDGQSVLSGNVANASTANTLFMFADDNQAIGASTTEASRTGICGPERFTLRNLRVNVSTAPGAGTPSRTIRFRKNSGDGSASVVLTTGTTGTDGSNTDVFDPADTISVTTVPASTPAATTRQAWAAIMVMDWQYYLIQKSMTYRVSREITAIQKGLIYRITREVTAITKGLIYRVSREISAITKGQTYSVAAERGITKTLLYKVNAEHPITKGLVYRVLYENIAIQKGLIYRVSREIGAITKGADYKVNAEHVVQKGLIYRVLHDVAAIQKNLEYVVVQVISIQKALSYEVRSEQSITKGLIYMVQAEAAAITKTLSYKVLAEAAAITKAVTYRVLHEVAAITKGLIYRVSTEAAAIQKDMEYSVAVEQAIQKTLVYKVQAEAALQKTLSYKVYSSDHVITKAMGYEIELQNVIVAPMEYRVAYPTTITKASTYAVIPFPYRPKNSPFTPKPSPYAKAVPSPFTRKDLPYQKTGNAPYQRRAR